jgi:hypothetical protein
MANQVVTISANDGTNVSSTTFNFASFTAIATRGLMYVGASGASASTSLATDKSALLPGQSSTFANYTNFSRGLNGLAIDLTGLPATTTSSQIAASLQFANWDGIAAAGFVSLPGAAVPTVTLLPSGGTSGSARVRITFPDNTVQNTWLRVTLAANSDTGLAANDVFYFGNVIGELGVGNSTTRLSVDAQDIALMLANQSPRPNSANATNIYDMDRNGRVNGQDYAILVANQQAAGIVAPITAPSLRPATAARSMLASDSGSTVIAAPLPSPEAFIKSTNDTSKCDEDQNFASSAIKNLFESAVAPQGNDTSTNVADLDLAGTNTGKGAEKVDKQTLISLDSIFASLQGRI